MKQETVGKSSNAIQVVAAPTRNSALDFTKGVLVLFMVLYHWLNYFYSPTGNFYRYLRFLTPSFIFITGFLISHVYFAKHGTTRRRVARRLAGRGLKILAVFIVLNGIIAVLPGSPTRSTLTEHSVISNLTTIFITGNGLSAYGKSASFSVLVPISYLLLISALLLLLSGTFRHIFRLICIGMFLCAVTLAWFGLQSTNLELLTIGLLGIVIGYAPISGIMKVVSNAYALGLAYCVYLCAITIWDVPLGLRISGVCLTVMIIYAIGASSQKPGRLEQHVIVLGKYSLFAYVWQIAILQLLHRVLGHGMSGISLLIASFILGFALTMVSVEALDHLRPRFRTLDQLYRVAFA